MAIKVVLAEKPMFFLRYNHCVTWVYLSPHFDDVALSCGGLVWEQAHQGESVAIWTICAGDAPQNALSPFARELHTRWEAGQNTPVQRKVEDINSCRRLGANYKYFSIPDCIYRLDPLTGEVMYASEAALNGPLHPGDIQVLQGLHKALEKELSPDVTLVCPLALGSHVDHQLTRLAVEGLNRPLWYYADFPYVLRCQSQVEQMALEGWESRIYSITADGLAAWQDSIRAHGSQISTFWPDELAMRQAVREYLDTVGGIRLWSKMGV